MAECALVLPVIFLVAFGTLEACSVLTLRQSATVVAFEGARIGVRGKTARQTIINECNAQLTARHIANGTVSVTPADFTNIQDLDPITVTIQAPYNGNTWFVGNLFRTKTMRASVTMVREYGN